MMSAGDVGRLHWPMRLADDVGRHLFLIRPGTVATALPIGASVTATTASTTATAAAALDGGFGRLVLAYFEHVMF